jgi:membrane-associated phospholipid phosphatase
MKHSNNIAELLSYLLSPVSIAFYIIIMMMLFLIKIENLELFIITILTAFVFLCITPIIGIIIYSRKGKIDIWVSEQKKRTPFYIIAILGYFLSIIIFYNINQHEFLVLSLAYIGVTLAITIVNLRTKISSHSAGLTGPFTAVIFMFGFLALPLFFLLPIIIWARLQLNAHSIAQLMGGGIIGFIVTASTYIIFY